MYERDTQKDIRDTGQEGCSRGGLKGSIEGERRPAVVREQLALERAALRLHPLLARLIGAEPQHLIEGSRMGRHTTRLYGHQCR